jgi:hypothetical protein
MMMSETTGQTINMGAPAWNATAHQRGMMWIANAGNMSEDQIISEIKTGGRLVKYLWTISLVIVTFKRSSQLRLIKAGETALVPGLLYSLLTFFVGWWGIPWGPIYTIQSIYRNFRGGVDFTPHVLVEVEGKTRLALLK